jgi:hypothetical protein
MRLMTPPRAGRVAALEDDQDLGAGRLDPALHLDEFGLQPEEILEIDAPVERVGMRFLVDLPQLLAEHRF